MAISPFVNEKTLTLSKGSFLFGDTRVILDPFGNVSAGNLTIKIDYQDMISGQSGFNEIYAKIKMKEEATIKMQMDNLTTKNLSKFLLANPAASIAQAAGTLVAQSVIVNKGQLVQLGELNGDNIFTPSYSVSEVIVTSDPIGTTYDVNVDYTLDEKKGRIYILPTGTITDGAAILIGCTVAADTTKMIKAGSKGLITGHILYIGNSPQGRTVEIAGYGQLTPDGDLPLVDDKLVKIGFTFTFLRHADYAAILEMLVDTEQI